MADFLKGTLGLGVSGRLFYGNSFADWVLAGILALAVWTALSIVRRLIGAR